MPSLVSIRLSDDLFNKMKIRAQLLHLSQTEYIRRAIEQMNSQAEALERANKLKQASLRVRKESMRINAVFSEIEHDIKD